MHTLITKDPAAATSAIQHLTAHVVGNLIAEQLVDPLSDEMQSVWNAVEQAVDRAIGNLDPNELKTAIVARQTARLERLEAQRAAWERRNTPAKSSDTDLSE